ncbi:MAG TPA: AAA family ATPase [Candidatus Bilamarchaeum sp.]|nr:AAA family ATPase [Candidatus Bilamarchaeum sp.]
MKGPNPFALWEEDPENISGRKDESRIFNGFVQSVLSGQGGVLEVDGGPGCGKTALLLHLHHEAEKAGILCPFVKVERGEGEADIVAKVAQDAMLPKQDRLDALARALEKAAQKAHFGAIIFIDDIDRGRKARELAGALVAQAKAGWGKRKLGFVIGATNEIIPESAMAGRIRLRPFEEHEAREFMEKALKKGPPKMGEECLQSLLSDTGGNPKLLKIVCRIIYEKLRDNEKIISKGHYLGYLPQIMSSLSREWFGRMLQETPTAEKAVLHAIAENEDGMHVSDISKKLGRPLGQVTVLTMRLLARGQIVRVDRGKYRIFSKLYARYVRQRS